MENLNRFIRIPGCFRWEWKEYSVLSQWAFLSLNVPKCECVGVSSHFYQITYVQLRLYLCFQTLMTANINKIQHLFAKLFSPASYFLEWKSIFSSQNKIQKAILWISLGNFFSLLFIVEVYWLPQSICFVFSCLYRLVVPAYEVFCWSSQNNTEMVSTL